MERHLNEESELAGEGARPPPAPEIERGWIRRAHKRLSERTNFLCGLLGQQMPLLENNDLGCFWRALHKASSQGVARQADLHLNSQIHHRGHNYER